MRKTLAALATALALAACSQPATTTSEELVTASATITAINPATRDVTLRDDITGETFSVKAGDEVQNFDQLAPGDVVVVDNYRSITATMAPPGTTAAAPETTLLAGRAAPGEVPGGLAAITTTVVVTLTSYDPATNVASLQLPDGSARTASVPADMQSFAASLAPGDQIEVTLTEAAAISIAEPGA
jgi:translation initiation factor IF-1